MHQQLGRGAGAIRENQLCSGTSSSSLYVSRLHARAQHIIPDASTVAGSVQAPPPMPPSGPSRAPAAAQWTDHLRAAAAAQVAGAAAAAAAGLSAAVPVGMMVAMVALPSPAIAAPAAPLHAAAAAAASVPAAAVVGLAAISAAAWGAAAPYDLTVTTLHPADHLQAAY